jgi:flotillin
MEAYQWLLQHPVVLGALIGLVGAGALLGVFALVATQLLYICPPNEALIFSGRKRRIGGGTVGYRVLIGGRAMRVPIVERVDRVSLEAIPVDLRIHNAFSKGGIALRVHAIANVKISSDPALIGNAIERFLGRDPGEIQRVARETLEGHLRGVLATLTPEEVNEDRLKFAHALLHECRDDFRKLGLALDTLKILNVADDSNYLASAGRAGIALVLRDAEVAESQSTSEAEQREAEARRTGEVANQTTETHIVQMENELRRVRAEIDAEAHAEEERTAQAALLARAEAEQRLQEVRKRLEEMRLTADVVLPAQAAQAVAAYEARGQAAAIAENARALAEAIALLRDAWVQAGEDAREIFLIQNLEHVLRLVVERVRSVSVREANLVDGGGGHALAEYVAGYPAMVRSVLEELRATTGIDVLGTLAPRVKNAVEGAAPREEVAS